MRHLHAFCSGLLARVQNTLPDHTCSIEAQAGAAQRNTTVARHFVHLGPEDADTLAIALLHHQESVCAYAFLCREDEHLLLKLSNGEAYDLEGDLSQAQLVNILANICQAPEEKLEVKIFSRKNDPALAVIDTIDDPFYEHYAAATDMEEILSPVVSGHHGPDCCQDTDGSYARSGGFSGRCFPL